MIRLGIEFTLARFTIGFAEIGCTGDNSAIKGFPH